MTYTPSTWLADCLRAADLEVNEVDGWTTRGRPSSTGEYKPSGIVIHHTASPAGTSDQSELNVILSGNSEAPGPISQLLIGREFHGVYVVAAGRSNHAGSGAAPWLGPQKVDGNANAVGIEVANNGTGERWPDWQTETYARTCAALLGHNGWPLNNIVTHCDFAAPYYPGSKIDPAGPWARQPTLPGGGQGTWNIDIWCDYVTTFLGTGPTPPVPAPSPPEDDMVYLGPYLIQASGADGTKSGAVYSTDGLMQTLRWLSTPDALAGYRWQIRQYGVSAPELEDGGPIPAVDSLEAFGVVIGPMPR